MRNSQTLTRRRRQLWRTRPLPAVRGYLVTGGRDETTKQMAPLNRRWSPSRSHDGGLLPRYDWGNPVGGPPGENAGSSVSDLIDPTEMKLRPAYALHEDGITPMRARIAERLGGQALRFAHGSK